MTPIGSQEAAGWAAALDRVANEMATLQRNMHTMAIQFAEADARVNRLDNRCAELERTGTTTAKHLSEACVNIVSRYLPRGDIDLCLQQFQKIRTSLMPDPAR
jgi:hypothetical protein